MCLLLNRLIQTKSIVDFSANSLSTFLPFDNSFQVSASPPTSGTNTHR